MNPEFVLDGEFACDGHVDEAITQIFGVLQSEKCGGK
jgi:hypothetical protein